MKTKLPTHYNYRRFAIPSRIALVAMALGASSLVGLPIAHAEEETSSTTTEVDSNGDSYRLFYDKLGSDGDWIQTQQYGYVFQPHAIAENKSWRPYTDGYWAQTDAGWTWVSNEPYGWATYHYGRWANIVDTGWVWVPGSEWSPGYVSWRVSKDHKHIGWAPLPPEARLDKGEQLEAWVDTAYDIGPEAYNFIDTDHFGEKSYVSYIAPADENVKLITDTENVTRVSYRNVESHDIVYNGGPDVEVIRQYGGDHPIRHYNLELHAQPANYWESQRDYHGIDSVNGDRLAVSFATRDVISSNTFHTSQPAHVRTRLSNVTVDRGYRGIGDQQAIEHVRSQLRSQSPQPPPQVEQRASAALRRNGTNLPNNGNLNDRNRNGNNAADANDRNRNGNNPADATNLNREGNNPASVNDRNRPGSTPPSASPMASATPGNRTSRNAGQPTPAEGAATPRTGSTPAEGAATPRAGATPNATPRESAATPHTGSTPSATPGEGGATPRTGSTPSTDRANRPDHPGASATPEAGAPSASPSSDRTSRSDRAGRPSASPGNEGPGASPAEHGNRPGAERSTPAPETHATPAAGSRPHTNNPADEPGASPAEGRHGAEHQQHQPGAAGHEEQPGASPAAGHHERSGSADQAQPGGASNRHEAAASHGEEHAAKPEGAGASHPGADEGGQHHQPAAEHGNSEKSPGASASEGSAAHHNSGEGHSAAASSASGAGHGEAASSAGGSHAEHSQKSEKSESGGGESKPKENPRQ